jgi:hypothetical protein
MSDLNSCRMHNTQPEINARTASRSPHARKEKDR